MFSKVISIKKLLIKNQNLYLLVLKPVMIFVN